MCCKRARPNKGRPTSLIRDIRDRASGGNQMHEASHPSRARPSEPNSTPPTGPAGLLMQPETASAINTGGPLHEPRYRQWVQAYADPDFAALAGRCAAMLDEAAADGAGPAERAKQLFAAGMAHELAFWTVS